MLIEAALALAAIGGLYVAATRAITVVDLECRDGRLRVVRGGIAPRILADLEDVVRTPPIAQLHIRVTRDGGRAKIAYRGAVDPGQDQRIRNVIGSLPLAKLTNARRKR